MPRTVDRDSVLYDGVLAYFEYTPVHLASDGEFHPLPDMPHLALSRVWSRQGGDAWMASNSAQRSSTCADCLPWKLTIAADRHGGFVVREYHAMACPFWDDLPSDLRHFDPPKVAD